MAFILTDDGQLEPGPPGDDLERQRNARLVADVAFWLEAETQMGEAREAEYERNRNRFAAIEARLAMLEDLLVTGSAS